MKLYYACNPAAFIDQRVMRSGKTLVVAGTFYFFTLNGLTPALQVAFDFLIFQ